MANFNNNYQMGKFNSVETIENEDGTYTTISTQKKEGSNSNAKVITTTYPDGSTSISYENIDVTDSSMQSHFIIPFDDLDFSEQTDKVGRFRHSVDQAIAAGDFPLLYKGIKWIGGFYFGIYSLLTMITLPALALSNAEADSLLEPVINMGGSGMVMFAASYAENVLRHKRRYVKHEDEGLNTLFITPREHVYRAYEFIDKNGDFRTGIPFVIPSGLTIIHKDHPKYQTYETAGIHAPRLEQKQISSMVISARAIGNLRAEQEQQEDFERILLANHERRPNMAIDTLNAQYHQLEQTILDRQKKIEEHQQEIINITKRHLEEVR